MMPCSDDSKLSCAEKEELCSSVYGYTAMCFLKPPDEKTVAGMDALADVLSIKLEPSGAADLPPLQQEYQDLFKVPLARYTTPYESVFLCKGNPSQTGIIRKSVQKLYETTGFEISNAFFELPDYIGTELLFVHSLISAEKQASQNNACKLALKYNAIQQDFLKEHLSKWMEPFAEKVNANASSSFYPNVMKIVLSIVNYSVQ